jgi:cyclopropane-fatty-acyl-phospholipid synthase
MNLLGQSALFRRLDRIRGGRLHLRLPDGTRRSFGDGSDGLEASVWVHDASVFRRALFGGDIAFGETYAEGLWTSPDLPSVTRLAVRNMASFEGGTRLLTTLGRWADLLRHRLRRNSLRGSRGNIRYHYDLGEDFYALFLDPSLTYSCAIFDPPGISLADAQREKLERIGRALELAPGDRLLEIGTGWGALAVFAARRGCRVTTTTISRSQYEFARRRFEEEGVADRVTLLLEDYRRLSGRFDKAVSIEMFEAVGLRYYDDYFGAVDRLLEPGATMLLQTIWMNEGGFPRYRRQPDFIQRYVFPGSELASLAEIEKSISRSTRLSLAERTEIGPHYVTTLSAWRERFRVNRDRVAGLGFPGSFVRMWEYYLAYCEGGFAEGYIGDAQLLLRKAGARPGDSRAGSRTELAGARPGRT